MCVNDQRQWENLVDLMEMERGILESCNELSIDIRASLHARNWPALEPALKRLDILARDLEDIESKRLTLSENLGDKFIEKKVMELPDELRKRFHYLKFELKASLLKVGSRVSGIAAYTESREGLVRELMEVLIPSAQGRVYNKQGQAVSTSGNPLVVSHKL